MAFTIDDILKNTEPKKTQSPPKIAMIHYKKLYPSDDNFYDTKGIEELAASFRSTGGILQPLLVKKKDMGEYEVIAGHRRRLAAIFNTEQRGLKEYEFLPCIVLKNEEEIYDQLSLILTNFSIRDKTEFEKMLEVIKLKEVISSLCETENKRLTARDLRKSLSETLGMSQTKIQDYMTIYKRLDKKSMKKLRSGEIGISAALELARMKNKLTDDEVSHSKKPEIKKNTEDKNVSESDINKRESKTDIVGQEQDFSKFISKPVDENVSDSDTNKNETKPNAAKQKQGFSGFMPKSIDENMSDSDTEYGIEDVRDLYKKYTDISMKDEKIIHDALTLLIKKFGGKCIEG